MPDFAIAQLFLLPQQQRAVKARHKDQWEGDRTLLQAIDEAQADPELLARTLDGADAIFMDTVTLDPHALRGCRDDRIAALVAHSMKADVLVMLVLGVAS